MKKPANFHHLLSLKLILSCALILWLQGCSITHHALGKPALGISSSSAEMERLIDKPGPIQMETINSADWSAPLSGLINFKSPAAIEAGLKDRDEPIHIYAHVLKHPQRGNYLVDTGVSQKLVDDPGSQGVSWIVSKAMHIENMKVQKGTATILQDIHGKLDGVFFTHLHLDHITGMPDIPNDVPLYIGASESTGKNWMNLFVIGSSDALLENKQPLQEWHFQPDPQNQFEGIVDIFEDGSVFAISVAGHTPGSIAYLVRTTQGPVLLTGDTCHTRWGWDHTVEPGDFTNDTQQNLKNLVRLKALAARHPQMQVRLGHQ